MKKVVVLFAVFLFILNSFGEEFDLGSIEVTDVSGSINSSMLENKSKTQIGEKEGIDIDYKGANLDSKQKISQVLAPDVIERSAFASVVIGDDSKNDFFVNYSEKNINYLWSGKIEFLSDDVEKINGKKKSKMFEFEYDDIWDNISFSTESSFYDKEEKLAGSDAVLNNSYYVEEKGFDLKANVFFAPFREWNFFGRIANIKKDIDSTFLGGYNDLFKNSIFEGKAYTQIDLSESSFVDIMLGLKTDSLDYIGGKIDNDRFDMEFNLNIIRKDYSVLTNLGVYNSDDDDEASLSVTYSKYQKNDKITKYEFGKKYTPLSYEDVFFAENQKYIVRLPVTRKLIGETSDFISIAHDFDYKDLDFNIKIGNESVDNKLYYSKITPNDRALLPAYTGSVDNFFINFSTETKLRGDRTLKLFYNHNNWDGNIPFVNENDWKVLYRHNYNNDTVFLAEAVFTGKYKDGLGVENDGYVLVNLSMDNKIDEKMNFRIDILNLMDKDYFMIPGYSEEERRINLAFSFNL
ncbi:MAG: hypothetical protein M0R46_16885 [Candidatus Muirbacterium halophilum]|nr:hypothetical protein [Candidatus Muirbacterium halophilum]